jgi:YidC/Oxa1 family membrane protein insertase
MNQEVMKLQKEHGNPLLGCLPLLLQIPLFISLYHVFNAVARAPKQVPGFPNILQFRGTSGLTGGFYDKATHVLGTYDAAHHSVVANSKAAEVAGLATAKFGGITLSSALTSSKKTLALFGADGTTVKIVAAIMIIFMAVTVYITQHQIMSRGGPVDPQQQKIQRIMLYGSPLLLAVFGLRFPIAVLVYWLVTNTWSMAQQVFILRKMPPVLPGTSAGTATSGRASAAAVRGKPSLRKGAAPELPAPQQRLTQRRQNPPPAIEASSDGADAADDTAAKPATADDLPKAESNGSADTGKGGGSGAAGRTVSSGGGQGQRPRRNNRPAAKPKGKGPRKGGRR